MSEKEKRRCAGYTDRICHVHESLIEAYYGRLQSAFERSNMGGTANASSLHACEEYAQKRGQHANRPGEIYSVYPQGDITAQPMNETREPGGMVPDDATLEDYAFVSRRELMVARRSNLLRDALEHFYGPVGAHWAERPHGRIASLYHLTAPGRAMLEHAEPKGAAVLGDVEASTMSRKQRRKALARAAVAPVDVVLERSLHGRMVALLAPASLPAHVREGAARSELAATALYRQLCLVWNQEHQKLEAEQGRATR
jgi:hypothetical protein